MKMSPCIAAIAAALAKAQGEIKNPGRDAANPFFKSTYAPLDTVIDSIKAAFAKNGIAYFQPISSEGPKVTATTVLLHSSGEWMEGDPLSATGKDAGPQTVGSVATYLRRYSLMASAGVAATNDDDAEAGEGRQTQTAQPPTREPPKTRVDTVKAKVAAANGHASPPMPKDAEARKLDLKARTQALGFKGPDVAKKIGEWIGRECDGATTITPDDWLKADAGITAAKTTKATLEAAGLAGEVL